MNYIYTMPNYIEDKEEVYEFITKLYDKFANTLDSKIILDFSLTSYINPNLMAPLGLVLTKIKYNNNLRINNRGFKKDIKRQKIKVQ